MKMWSEEEVEYLKSRLNSEKSESYKEVAEKLNRTISSVRGKAHLMGLDKNKNIWSEDDLIYLEYFLYDNEEKRYEEAAKFLGRTVKAVTTKAAEMRKENENVNYIAKPYSRKEIQFLRANYTVLETDQIAKSLNRTIKSVMRKASVLGINKRKSLTKYDSKIRKMATNGKTRNEIAFELGVKPNSVICYLIRHGIECEYAPKELSQQYFREQENLRRAAVNHRFNRT